MQRRLIPPWVLGVLLLALPCAPALAQRATMLKDVNFNQTSSDPTGMVAVYPHGLFLAFDDGIHGRELWLYADGAMRLVKDLRPGAAGSNPTLLTNTSLGLVFAADDGTGAALWRSDGSAAGTVAVKKMGIKQIIPTSIAPDPNGLFYLIDSGDQAWRSNGTAAGTWRISSGLYPASQGRRLFFVSVGRSGGVYPRPIPALMAYDPDTSRTTCLHSSFGYNYHYGLGATPWKVYYRESATLWRVEGGDKTVAIHNYDTGKTFLFAPAQDVMFFIHSGALWANERTTTATIKLAAVEPGTYATAYNRFYYVADGAGGGQELWCAEKASSTWTVKKVFSGPAGTAVSRLAPLVTVMYFQVTRPGGVTELWASSGSETRQTVKVADLSAGGWSPPVLFTHDLYDFCLVRNAGHGWALWLIEPFFWETHVKYIGPMSEWHSSPQPLGVVAGGRMLFSATDGVKGRELYATDGTEAGTVLVKDVNPGTTSGLDGPSPPVPCQVMNGSAYFAADDGVHGRELWTSDGTAAGTRLVKDWYTGPGNAGIEDLYAWNGRVFWRNLCASDGSEAGTGEVELFSFSGGNFSDRVVPYHNRLYFPAWMIGHGSKPMLPSYPGIYRTDGTKAGTVRAVEHPWGAPDNMFEGRCLGTVNDRLVHGLLSKTYIPTLNFSAVSSSLDSYDDATSRSARLASFSCRDDLALVRPAEPTNVNGVMFMSVGDASHGRELFRTDGVTSVSGWFLDINRGTGGSNPTQLTALGNRLIFAAGEGTAGTELWASEGTTQTTVRLGDLRPGAAGSKPIMLGVLGGQVIFSADDGVHGRELWGTRGTPESTALIRDVNAGAVDSTPTLAIVMGKWMFLTAEDGVHGRELWRTDGTAAGTALVQDIRPGAEPAVAENFMVLRKDAVFFTADDGQHGNEPWILEMSNAARGEWRGYR